MGLAFRFRFWIQVQCFGPCDRDQHALTQVHHPCHLTTSTNWVHLMANNSSSAFASDGKMNTALLTFGNGKGCVYFVSWGCVYFASWGCFASWGEIKYMVLYWRIRTGSDWWFSKICGSGLDQIQLLRIRIGLGPKNFTVHSSLQCLPRGMAWCPGEGLWKFHQQTEM